MNEQDMPQKYMAEIHRWVQKLKQSGMNVDSVIKTTTTVVEDTVKYVDSLVITGDFSVTRFDTRSLADVKADAENEKLKLQAQLNEQIAVVDEVISVVEPAIVSE